MKSRYTIFVLLIAIVGCSNVKEVKQSENKVLLFFDAIKQNDQGEMIKNYKGITTFDSYYKSDSINILESKRINDSLISVRVKNFFTNGFGKFNINEITLYVARDSIKVFSKIIDSKGLTNHNENKLFDFAVNTGCLEQRDTTDILKNTKFREAHQLLYNFRYKMLTDFMTNVKVISWDWRSGYGGSASGKGIVRNNTNFIIPKLKYKIKYTNRAGDVLTTDDGYVSYNKIEAGQSKSFTFYTSYVGNARSASINLDFDEEMIEEYLLKSKEYHGNEFEEYLAEKPNLNTYEN